MAIIDPWSIPIDINSQLNSQQYAIQGRMIKSHIVMNEMEFLKIDPRNFQSDIKERLMSLLLFEAMQTKCIEFTKFEDQGGRDTHFRARMFAVPDNQVRILRVSHLNNTSN
jgi:hypothetical protein